MSARVKSADLIDGRRSLRTRPAHGFTLVELLIVVVIVGILSGLALPQLRRAIVRARAVAILAEVNTIRLAAHQALAQDGRFPRSRPWGTIPSAMVPHLAEGYSFEGENGVRYRWIRRARSFSPWGVEMGTIGVLAPGSPRDKELIKMIASMSVDALTKLYGGGRIHIYVLP